MRRQMQMMGFGFRKQLLVAAIAIVALFGVVACGGGGTAEVSAPRGAASDDESPSTSGPNADSDAEYAAAPGSGTDASAEGSDYTESTVGDFEESDAAPGDAALGAAFEDKLSEVACAPVNEGSGAVKVGPKWTPELAYDVFVFEGPTEPTENEFSVAVLDPGFSAATLEWTHRGAVVDGENDETDQLPTVAYYVSPEGQIDGLANADDVREQAIAINADLADEVSEEAAEQGRAMIEGLPDEALIALYASREVFFHSLDGFELTMGTPLKFSTSQPDAGSLGLEVPATTTTQIESIANDAGCVVVTQTTEPNEQELETILDQGPVLGKEYTVETLPTFANTLTAWVDGTTGEVRRLSRQETRRVDGEESVMTTFDLVALDAE